MKKAIVIASVAAALASPLAAQSVPLNTVSGGEGKEVVQGQAGLAGGGLGIGLVVGLAVLAVVAASDSSSSSSTEADAE